MAAQPFAGVLGRVASRVRLSVPEQLRPGQAAENRRLDYRRPAAGRRVCGRQGFVDAG